MPHFAIDLSSQKHFTLFAGLTGGEWGNTGKDENNDENSGH